MNGSGGSAQNQAPGELDLNQKSSEEFEFLYDLAPSDLAFAFVTLSQGGFNAQGNFEGTALNLPQTLTFAARGADETHIKVEITDTQHRQANFILELRPYYQNFALDLNGIHVTPGFDRTSIAQITFSVDRKLAQPVLSDVVRIKTKGLFMDPVIYPSDFLDLKTSLITKGADYFTAGKGIDPVTHLPYDTVEANGIVHPAATFSQPTSIGFYLQILGEAATGKISNGMNTAQALTEADAVLNSLLTIQANTNLSWKGLMPWVSLPSLTHGPMGPNIGIGDNANLAQSIAVMIGMLESASLTPAQKTQADALILKAEQVLANQSLGFQAFVDPTLGVLRASYNTSTQNFSTGHIDRLANEFRGAVAFVTVYFGLPETVWTGLTTKYEDYTIGNEEVDNLAYYEGGAFQAFWPGLRNDESAFKGFNDALYNALVTFTDFSAKHHLPGFLSASQRPNDHDAGGEYYGRIGIPDIAESIDDDEFLIDVASTYGLASAYAIDPLSVLNWLNEIEDQLPEINGMFGFFDAARSDEDITKRFLGIDLASTILALSGQGPEAFEAFMTKRGLQVPFNLLYDQVSKQILENLQRTDKAIAVPPQFPDETFSVFTLFDSEGTLGDFPFVTPTTFTRAVFDYDALSGGFGGRYWELDQDFDARNNDLVISYSGPDSPGSIKIELKDEFDQLLYTETVTLTAGMDVNRVVLHLPGTFPLSVVRKIFVVIDQNATGDTSGDFLIHAIDFQEYSPA